MSSINYTRMDPPLHKLMYRPGGIKMSEAVRRADENLAALHDESLLEIDRALVEMVQLAPAWPGSSEALYDLGVRVIDACAAPEEAILALAARSLCEIIDAMPSHDRRAADAVAVHVKSLLLMRQSPDPAVQETIGGQLKHMSQKLLERVELA